MIDFDNLSKYKENNCIEAKKAQGGLPRSIWETYSAFANTIGGVILLGVIEQTDKTLCPVGIPNPDQLVQDFWNGVNNPSIVSANILRNSDVQVIEVDDKQMIAIEVPRATRQDKPVFIGSNPMFGSYRRNGEGDYHCTNTEVRNMLRDQADGSQDTRVLESMGMEAFDGESLKRYRIRMANARPGHVWESLDDEAFLQKLGAVGRGEDHQLHPTAAGLLMFGFESEIVREFPDYFLDYQEKMDPSTRWTDRIISSSGDWSGNVFDFYFRVYNQIQQSLKVPFQIKDGLNRIDDTPVHKALREALANAMIHANYYDRRGLVIIRTPDDITISNPGNLRIDLADAFSGGISDPRNATLIKMFNLISIGERAGSGLPDIHATWMAQGFGVPVLQEAFNPDRTTLTLSFSKAAIKNGDKKSAIKSGDKIVFAKTEDNKQMILDYLQRNIEAKSADLTPLLESSPTRVKELLAALIAEDLVVAQGSNRNRVYRLKS